MQQQAQFYAVCAGTPNHSCLMLCDVMNYNDAISTLSSYVFGRNIHFIGIYILKSFSV